MDDVFQITVPDHFFITTPSFCKICKLLFWSGVMSRVEAVRVVIVAKVVRCWVSLGDRSVQFCHVILGGWGGQIGWGGQEVGVVSSGREGGQSDI